MNILNDISTQRPPFSIKYSITQYTCAYYVYVREIDIARKWKGILVHVHMYQGISCFGTSLIIGIITVTTIKLFTTSIHWKFFWLYGI